MFSLQLYQLRGGDFLNIMAPLELVSCLTVSRLRTLLHWLCMRTPLAVERAPRSASVPVCGLPVAAQRRI